MNNSKYLKEKKVVIKELKKEISKHYHSREKMIKSLMRAGFTQKDISQLIGCVPSAINAMIYETKDSSIVRNAAKLNILHAFVYEDKYKKSGMWDENFGKFSDIMSSRPNPLKEYNKRVKKRNLKKM